MGNVKDISGQMINDWEVIKECGRNKSGGAMFLCRCSCGTEKLVDGRSIRAGTSRNCGCKRFPKMLVKAREVTTKHGGKNDRLYNVWNGMKDGCHNEKSKFYNRYGGRGIKVCDEWSYSYPNFKDWAMNHGYDPCAAKGKCTIERLNNDGDYSPDNCIWATSKVQCNNRSSNHSISALGETHTISEWSEITGIRKDTLRRRICIYGWDVERAITEPVHRKTK